MSRHPDDPEPVLATKARAVWWLGLVAVLTGPLVGGLVPATVALLLAAQFRQQARPAGGFLTGAAMARRGVRLAWAGITLSVAVLVLGLAFALVQLLATSSGPEFGPSVN